MMVTRKCLIGCLLASVVVVVAAQAHAHDTSTRTAHSDPVDAPADDLGPGTSNRTGRIMKILRDPQSTAPPGNSKRLRSSQKSQSRRERLPPQQQHPSAHMPPQRGLSNLLGGLRRVHSGPPPMSNVLMHHPSQPPASAISQQLLAYGKGSVTIGKGSSHRPQFVSGPHPNSLPPPRPHSSNSFINFKPSPQYSGTPILRPAKTYPQYTKLLKQYLHNPDVRQHPLPQQHPQLQLQQQQKKLPQYFSKRPNDNTAPQTFLAPQQKGSSASSSPSSSSSSSGVAGQQTYAVYEEPEFNDRPPTTEAPRISAKEAEDYIKFMSTNEYFLPKVHPNYKQLDEASSVRQYRHQPQPQPSIQYSKAVPANSVGSVGSFKRPHDVAQLFYQPAASSSSSASASASSPAASSAVVRSSYQAGKNAFIVRSDGNKAVKHVITSPLATPPATSAPSYKHSSYQQFNLRPQKPQTDGGPVHFEFTENDAVRAAQAKTKSPPSLRYKAVGNVVHAPSGVFIQHSTGTKPSATSFVYQKYPTSANEVDSDPEDGDDMHDTATGTFGRVPIRNPLQKMSVDHVNVNESSSIAPATEQKDTEEFCERMCSNVQDNEEVVCGSDGYMYTGEAQLECYASCLHIEVKIQGKGTCSAKKR